MMPYEAALEIGANLLSEHGENPEYDRALSELLGDMYLEEAPDVLGDLRTMQQEVL